MVLWLLIILYFFFGAASYLLRRVLAQEFSGHIRLMNSVFFICFLLPVGFVYALFVPHDLNIGWINLAILLGGSLIWPVVNLVAFYANKHTDVGIFTVINNISPVFTVTVALLLLNENLSLVQFAGVVLLIFSGIIATLAQLKGVGRAGLLGVGLSLLAAMLLGLAIAYERFMLNRIDFGSYIIYGWGSQVLWAATMSAKELHKIPSLFTRGTKTRELLFAWGTTSSLKSAAFLSALKLGTASLVSSAANFLSVVVVIAAYIFLKEHDHTVYKILATAAGITGLFLIAG